MRKNSKHELSLAIARGEPIAEWAIQNGVPRSTAFRWASDPMVRREVQAWRRRALDQTIGRMTALSTKVADGIAKLAKGAESESVQLRAWRAVLADQIAVSKFSDLEYRMTEIEEELNRRGYTVKVG